MKLPITIATTISICLSLLLLYNSSTGVLEIHRMCVDKFQESTKHRETLSALVCGARMQNTETLTLFAQSSLLHLLIVSGSHLVFVDQVLIFLRLPFFVRILLCLFYSFACNFEAPVVRALGANLLRGLFKLYKTHLPQDREPLFSSAWALLVKPEWTQSLSFMMSWCASLALSGPFKGPIALAITTYVMMLVPIFWISPSHPIGILFNLLLAPLLSFVLFPLAISTLILPTESLFNIIFDALLWVLEKCTQGLPPLREPSFVLPFFTLWLWVLMFHFLFYWRKKSANTKSS